MTATTKSADLLIEGATVIRATDLFRWRRRHRRRPH